MKIPATNKVIINFIIAVIVVTAIAGYDKSHNVPVSAEGAPVTSPKALQSPSNTKDDITIVSSPTPSNAIEAYIIEKFGEHSDKALLLLRGDGVCSGENPRLNPKAVNDNREWGGIGRDRGIFQINDMFHPIDDACAFDYKCNINYAHRMFLNDNYTFVRWTAGRCMGI